MNCPQPSMLTFGFEFHLPYLAWRSSHGSREDFRTKISGSPFRKRRNLSFLSGNVPAGKGEADWLYEGKTSFVLTAYDVRIWTAHLCTDTYYDGESSVDSLEHREATNKLSDAPLHYDPLIWGAEADKTCVIGDPRQYFLRVLGSRVHQVREEWGNVIHRLTRKMQEQARHK